MKTTLHALRLLAVVVWVGGLIFFAFVVAPVAFGALPTHHLAGLVVAGTLAVLHRIALICFAVFLLATLALLTPANRRLLAAEIALITLMALTSALVQLHIVPAMERDRIAAGGDIDAAPPDNPYRQDFERLHPISEKTEGAVLFLGLALVILIAFEHEL